MTDETLLAYETVTVHKAALMRLLAETRAPVALGQITARTAWDHLAEACGIPVQSPSNKKETP